MAVLSDKGAHCALPGCKQFDLLPFRCESCSDLFCLEHFRHDAHCCSKAPDASHTSLNRIEQTSHISVTAPKQKKERCPVLGCRTALTLSGSVVCPRCRLRVCLHHRYEDAHHCKMPSSYCPKTTMRQIPRLISTSVSRAKRRTDMKAAVHPATKRCENVTRSIGNSRGSSALVAQRLVRSAAASSKASSDVSRIDKSMPSTIRFPAVQKKAVSSTDRNPKSQMRSVATRHSNTNAFSNSKNKDSKETMSSESLDVECTKRSKRVDVATPSLWLCSMCTLRNYGEALKCNACDGARPKAVAWNKSLCGSSSVIDLDGD